ncbi:MAG: hypothetical protein EP307_06260 [Rhodobacteraceae bacterium]|nr:MAG: hypothetical protein EP307_06260 [Paracoccaceae bacterium]
MPNAVAYLALMAWPVVCLVLFQRLRPGIALIWSILGGYLLLPELTALDLPLVPSLDKTSVPALSALVIMVMLLGLRPSFVPRDGIVRLLVLVAIFGAVPTVLTNPDPILFQVLAGTDPIRFITDALPGLRTIDLVSAISTQVLMLLPFFLARAFLGTEDGLRALLVAFLLAGLAYSVPALLEVRISPQLNILIYGFFQHSWEQMIREGGFRPIVFLPHALWLAMFFVTAALAAAALARGSDSAARPRLIAALVYLVVVVWLCKSLASKLYLMAFVPMVLFAPPRWQIRAAVAIAVVAIVYPMLRNLHLIPLDLILRQAEAYSAERAQSLGFRFGNEEQLLARAAEKPWFGWGGWGRNLIRDAETGAILTIPDGRWIIMFGTHGWVGYLAQMGLLTAPLFLLGWRMRRLPDEAITPTLAALCLILAVTLLDMLLNDTLVAMIWMVSGAVLARVEVLSHGPVTARRSLFPGGPAIGRDAGQRPRSLL